MPEHAVDEALRALFRAEEGPEAPLPVPRRRPRRRPRPALLLAGTAILAVLAGSAVLDVLRGPGGDGSEGGCIVLVAFDGRSYQGFWPLETLAESGRLLGGGWMPTGCNDVDDGHTHEPEGERLVEVRALQGIDPTYAVAVNYAEWPGRQDWIFVADQTVCAHANATKEAYVACLRAVSPSPASLP